MDVMMDVREAARGAGGEVLGDNARFTTVSTDTRTIGPGALFVALRGENFDGHAYLAAARARGGQICVPVEILAAQRNEQRARSDRTRVSRYRGEARVVPEYFAAGAPRRFAHVHHHIHAPSASATTAASENGTRCPAVS